LLIKLTTDNISYQIIIATVNSKSPSSLFAKNLALLNIVVLLSVSDTSSKASILHLEPYSLYTVNTTLQTSSCQWLESQS
jgi:hypothetical protein